MVVLDYADRLASGLAYVDVRRPETAGALAEQPKPLFLDEPAARHEGQLRIHLVGKLTALPTLGQSKQPGLDEAGLQVTLVAGARNPRQLLLPPISV